MDIVDRKHQLAVAVVRVAVGIIFLTAGVEKIFGAENWSAAGFLENGTAGSLGWPWDQWFGTGNPTQDFWVGLAANESAMTAVNWLVPYGQVAIGASLILGLLTRFGAAMGTLMMLIFFVAAWDFQFGIVNQHLTYALVTFLIGYLGAGNYYGLDGMIGRNMSPFIRKWFLSGDHHDWADKPTASAMPA